MKIAIVLGLLVGLASVVPGAAEVPPTVPGAGASPSAVSRDPFQPPNLKPKRIRDESRPELEQYELSELRLTGVVTGADGNLSASVETASGRGFMVKKGATIGVNRGKIVEITMDRILVEEIIVNELGQNTTTTSEMTLRRNKDGSKKPS